MASVGHSRSRCRHSSRPQRAVSQRAVVPQRAVLRGRCLEGDPSRAEGLPVRRGGRLGCCDRGAWGVLPHCLALGQCAHAVCECSLCMRMAHAAAPMPLRKRPNWLRASFFRWCVSPSLACWLAMHSGKERLQGTGQGVRAGHGSSGELEGTGQGVSRERTALPTALACVGVAALACVGLQPGVR